MQTTGKIQSLMQDIEGNLLLAITVENTEENIDQIRKLDGERLQIDIKKYRKKRSLNANAYFWKLCGEIAGKLGTGKDAVYLMMLKEAGVFDYYELPLETTDQIISFYRYAETDHTWTEIRYDSRTEEESIIEMAALHCYKGSHEYDTKQMSDLINYTVNQAHDLGIDTWQQEEIENLIGSWKPERE